MNYKDVYQEFMEDIFEQHHRDIEETIAYIAKNIAKIYEWKPDIREARKRLTPAERNAIIWHVITPF